MNDLQKQIKKTLGESVGAVMHDDLKQFFDLIVSMFKEMKGYLEGQMIKGDENNSEMCKSMISDMDAMEKKIMDMMKSKCSSEEMDKAIKGVMAEISSIKASIPTMPDLSVYEGKLEEIRASIPVIKEQIKPTAEETRDLLESIKLESEKLDINAIGFLREELDKLKKIRSTGNSYSLFGGGSSDGGHNVKSYDLSSLLDGGVTRTFSTPAMWRPISIHLSSFPSILRETVDYTWTPQSITITSEIPDNSLSAGQTFILVYSE